MFRLCFLSLVLALTYTFPIWDIPDVDDIQLPRFAKKLLEKEKLDAKGGADSPLPTVGGRNLSSNHSPLLPDYLSSPVDSLPSEMLPVSTDAQVATADSVVPSDHPSDEKNCVDRGLIHPKLPGVTTTADPASEIPSLKELPLGSSYFEFSLARLADVAMAILSSLPALAMLAVLAMGKIYFQVSLGFV
jgi:hypothetical protein